MDTYVYIGDESKALGASIANTCSISVPVNVPDSVLVWYLSPAFDLSILGRS